MGRVSTGILERSDPSLVHDR